MELKEKVVEVIEDFKKENTVEKKKYFVDQTLYVALDEDLNATPSHNIDVLNDAKEAILILVRNEIAETRWYNHYTLKHIDACGNVYAGFRHNDLKISTCYVQKFANQRIILSIEGGYTYIYDIPYYYSGNTINMFKNIWEVFQFVKDFKTEKEIRWGAKFFITNRDLVAAKEKLSFAEMQERFLKKQLNQLNQCIDEIKSLIEGKKKS